MPQGYNIWKSVFYKEVDNNICFFVYGKKVIQSRVSSIIEVFVDAVPYCADLQSNEYEPQESATSIVDILKILTPDIITPENVRNFFISRFVANDEEATRNSLNNLCNDMESIILPYIHKFADLEYYYNEISKIWRPEKNEKSYVNYFTYGLSLKLHKYDTAIPYLEHQLEWHNNIIKRSKSDIEELKKGNIAAIFNMPITDEFISELLKKRPDFVESQAEASEKMITASEKEINKLQMIKVALSENDHAYIDTLVEETESTSRNYIRQMLTSGT